MIPLCVPEIQGNAWKYVKECLDTGWVSSAGPFVERFEREVERYTGAAHAVATVNGTAALHVALKAIGLQPDDEVIVPDLTFVAPANAVRYCQAQPIFMDVDPCTWQMDPAKLARFLETEVDIRGSYCLNKRSGRRVRAILPVHNLGNACEIDRILELAKRFDLRVIEDAAAAIGVRYRGRHVGTFGDLGIISFNGNKTVTSGGGGMILTNDAEHAHRAYYLTTVAKDDGLEFSHHDIGFNYRLSNLHAALGLAQMESLEEFVSRKRSIAHAYNRAFERLPNITAMSATPHAEPTYWQYMLLLSPDTTLVERQALIQRLINNGVASRPFWRPLHTLPPYQHCQAYQIEHSAHLYQRGIGLPCSVGLTEDDQKIAIGAFLNAVQQDSMCLDEMPMSKRGRLRAENVMGKLP